MTKQYKATDFVAPGPGKLTMSFTPVGGSKIDMEVYDFAEGGVAMAMYNIDSVNFLRTTL